jgi:hypothetical protein
MVSFSSNESGVTHPRLRLGPRVCLKPEEPGGNISPAIHRFALDHRVFMNENDESFSTVRYILGGTYE